MKNALFPKLAWTGIKKNRKLYIPYILSCIGMVMMFYIIQSLSYSPLLKEMAGGGSMGVTLGLGKFVILAFALVFLFYTNSFLIRRRYREFGLYNVLGMDKRGISRIIAWESLIVSAIGLVGGLGLGIAFSKFAELGLLNAIHADIDYSFTVKSEALIFTVEAFGAIFLLLFVKSLIQVRKSKPLELIRSENAGEKAPKANWVMAVLGLLLLAAAYFIAVRIKSPLSALTVFFVAVLMVIAATYMLFMSGSVALCKVLQKNKNYYYKKNHFVSVSSMAFRMKRNGAGLASICILSTMVLVMLTSTSSLYFGANDSIASRYPRNNEVALELNGLDNLSEEKTSQVKAGYQEVFDKHGVEPQNICEYRYAYIAGLLDGSEIQPDISQAEFNPAAYENLRQVYFVSDEDYNAAMGTKLSLKEGEAMLYPLRCEYDEDSLQICDVKFNISGQLDEFISISDANVNVFSGLMLVIDDYSELKPLETLIDGAGDRMLGSKWNYGYDLDVEDEEAIAVYRDQLSTLDNVDFILDDEGGYSFSGGCKAAEKDDFFVTFGGLFFVGIILSIVFIFAAVMIIYYKQVSEGYEDQRRFEIMQNVGMTKQDIKKSINSQVLTVFFAPLVFAGLHLGFAFPLVWKILKMFNLHNLSLVIWVNIGAFLVFGIFYAIVYKLTAGAYYNIVSDKEG